MRRWTRRVAVRAGVSVIAAAASSGTSFAQPEATRRIGWIAGSAGALPTPSYLEGMREGLRDRGWVEGRNVVIDARWGDPKSAAELAQELLKLRPDVLVTQGAMVLGARTVNGEVPIVFGFSGDPIEAGLVRSFAKPGGSLTGIAMQSLQLVGKRLQILKEIMPSLARVAILANPAHPGEQLELKESRAAADRLGLRVQYLAVRSRTEFDEAFAEIRRERPQAIVAFPDALVMSMAATIAQFSREQAIPAVSGWSEFVDAGNFMSYGPNLRATWRQAAGYVDRLLRGARAAEIPVEQPVEYELVIDERLSQALGLAIPDAVRLQAQRIVK